MRVSVFVGLIVLLVLLGACDEKAPRALNEFVSEAASYLHEGDIRAALIVLKNGVRAYPNDAGLRLLLASTYVKDNDGALAEVQAQKAGQLGARVIDVKFTEVEALLLQQAFRKAKAILNEDFKNLPSHEAIRHLELDAEADFFLGDVDGAKRKLGELARHTTLQARSLVLQSRIADLEGNSAIARSLLEKALAVDSKSYVALTALGNYESRDHNWDVAVSLYTDAVDLGVTATEALWGRAFANVQRGQFDMAAADAAALRRGRSETPASAFLSGLVMLSKGQYEDALAMLQLADKPEFEIPILHLMLGIAHFHLGEFYLADQNLRSYLFTEGSDVEAELLLAQVRFANGDAPGAIAVLDEILRRDPGNIRAAQMKARQRIEQGALSEANALLAGISESNNGSADLLLSRGILSIIAGNESEGVGLLEQTDRGDGIVDVRGLTVLALKEIDEKQYESARGRIEAIEGFLPDRALAYSLYGALYLAQNELGAAEAAFKAALKAEPAHVPSIRGLSSIALLQNDVKKAERIYEEGLAVKPRVVALNIGYAELALRSGNEGAYETRLRNAVKLVPSDPRPATALIRYLLTKNRLDDAASVASATKDRRFIANDAFIEAIGDLSLATKRNAQAVDAYKKLTEMYPRMPGYWLKLAIAQQRNNDRAGAKSSLRTGLDEEPNNLNLLASLATLEIADRNFDRARQYISVIDKVGGKGFIYNNVNVRLSMAMGKFADAAKFYRELYTIVPNETHAIGVVKSLLQSGDLDLAMSEAEQFIQEYDNSVPLRVLIAQLYKKRGANHLAIEAYRSILAKDPGSAVALNNLSVLLTSVDPAEAVEKSRMVYEKHPDDVGVVDTYAWALFHNRDPLLAAQVYGRLDETKLSLIVKYHYAVVLESIGSKAEARQLLSTLRGTPFSETADVSALIERLGM